MNRAIASTVCFALCIGVVFAPIFNQRSLDEKIKDADLIVLGTATAIGDKFSPASSGSQYERNLRVEVKQVLWPPSLSNTDAVVFRYLVCETWPKSWWDYTNTPGVFFLTKNQYPERGRWDRLDRYSDWMEPVTNALAVLVSLEKLKGKPAPGVLQMPGFQYPRDTRYDDSQTLRLAYLSSFRDGYYDALAGKHGFLMFSPTNEVDKAKVLGYADGQVAGDVAGSEWVRKLDALMK